jgi:hypothetical protein
VQGGNDDVDKEGTTMWMMIAAAGLTGACSAVLLTLSVYYR